MIVHSLATVTLGPVLLVQGRQAKRKALKLPEAPGPRHGTTGSGPPLRLLVTGDSSGAGVGAPHQDQALLGRLVQNLADHFTVTWTLSAKTSSTTPEARARLDELGDQTFDVAVTALGVNDIAAGTGLTRWRRQQAALWTTLRERFRVKHIVVSGLPPVHRFPLLPNPLRWYLGRRATEFEHQLIADVNRQPDSSHLDLRFDLELSSMAADGFHPGPPVYAAWGQAAAEVIRARFG